LAPTREEEAAALAAELRALLAAPERLRAMGEAAREHVRREHDPERSAEAVVAACRGWAALPPPGTGRRAEGAPAPPPARGDLAGEIEVAGADLPWAEGERRTIAIRLVNHGFARWLAGDRGPGGMAVVVKLLVGWHDLLSAGTEGGRWLPLPRDLAPGE